MDILRRARSLDLERRRLGTRPRRGEKSDHQAHPQRGHASRRNTSQSALQHDGNRPGAPVAVCGTRSDRPWRARAGRLASRGPMISGQGVASNPATGVVRNRPEAHAPKAPELHCCTERRVGSFRGLSPGSRWASVGRGSQAGCILSGDGNGPDVGQVFPRREWRWCRRAPPDGLGWDLGAAARGWRHAALAD